MEREALKEVLLSQVGAAEERIIPRSILAKIGSLAETPFIIILTGVRRCGKSTVLQEIRDEQCHYVNFDDDRLIRFTVEDFQLMLDLLNELHGERETYIFDEIQNIPGWERFVRRLHDQKRKVYISGSNASMLSRELGTHLTGRSIALSMYPFSFSEYLGFKGLPKRSVNLTSAEKSRLKRAYNEYLREGGFPEYLRTGKEEYLKNLEENILYRDIITRYKLSAERPIKETVQYIASNIGKELSFNTIRKLTGLTSATTVKEYIGYLENSYLCFLIHKYDPSLKRQAYGPKKAYFIDTGLARLLGFRVGEDKGRLMENLLFLSLKRKDPEIYFHKGEKECDFLVREKGRIRAAIQVTTALKETNREREIAGLLEAMRKHKLTEGLIITEDQEEELLIEKRSVRILPIWKWLLENE